MLQERAIQLSLGLQWEHLYFRTFFTLTNGCASWHYRTLSEVVLENENDLESSNCAMVKRRQLVITLCTDIKRTVSHFNTRRLSSYFHQ